MKRRDFILTTGTGSAIIASGNLFALPEDQLTYARILGMLGNASGGEVLQEAVENASEWIQGGIIQEWDNLGKASAILMD